MRLLHLDGTTVTGETLGMGASGLVIRDGEFALKIPRLWQGVDVPENGRLTPGPEEFDMRKCRIDQMEQEKSIFRRLRDCPGVVPCVDLDSPEVSIRMRRMANADLRKYLERGGQPSRSTQLSWFMQLAHSLSEIHRRKVIVADLRSENILLAEDLSVYFADFGESSLMPDEWDMKKPNPDDAGESVATDIGQLGAVMFEVSTGSRCHFDLMQDRQESGDPFSWPRRGTLPATQGLWLGDIIEACWVEGSFTSAGELKAALKAHALADGRKDAAILL